MVFYALSFLAGIVLVQQFSVLPDYPWLIAGVVAAIVITWLRYWRSLFFVIGILWAALFAMIRLADRLPEQLEGIDIPVKGYISELPKRDEMQSRFDFIVTESAQKLPSRLRLSWYNSDQPIKAGQRWAFTVKLKRPHGTLNPGGFDYERWLFIEGVGATGYVRAYPKPEVLGRNSAWTSTAVWRQNIIDRLDQMAVEDASGLALIKALTIGEGNGISQTQWELFRKTGTTHLIVISGSHIGLIAGLIYFLVLRFWAWTGILTWPPQKVAAVSALLVAVFYSALAGFSVPTQRAVIMLAVVMTAIILQRNNRLFNTVAIALFAILLYDPIAVLSAGFWLSFLAVAIIIYAVAGRLAKPGYIEGVAKINWATTLGLSPLLLLFFQQVSLIAPVANFIAVPVISLLVVPLSLIAVMMLFISPLLVKALLLPVEYTLQGLCWLLGQMATIPLATITHPKPSIFALLFAVPGILLLLAPKGIPARWLGLVLFLPLTFAGKNQPELGEIKMTLLDVGQGLSAVVQTAHHQLVFDAGAKFSGDSDMGKIVVMPFLQHQGIGRIDKLIVSHGDNDHIGGADSLLQGIPTETVMTSVPQQLAGYSPIACNSGQTWVWDQVSFTVLSPPSVKFLSENDNSCVLKIQSAHGTLLLTGDIETEAESWLVANYREKLKADILIAPHHGSKTSSSANFLQTVQPTYVLISAGFRNQFGHPHQDVLSRYKNFNALWLNTADSGAIAVSLKFDLWDVQALRETESRYWNFK